MSQPEPTEKTNTVSQNPYGRTDGMSDLTYAIGVILGLSYPILAFSTGSIGIKIPAFSTAFKPASNLNPLRTKERK